MSTGGYKITDQSAVHFVTFTVVEWVDVFTWKEYRGIVVQSLRYCQQEKDLIIYAWCLMSNHLHLLVRAQITYLLSSAGYNLSIIAFFIIINN